MAKDELLRAFADAYERLIATATEAEQRGVSTNADGWGPRAIVAHLAGWEAMATVRVPAIVGGMEPLEESDPAREKVLNDAINGAFVALAGDQPLEAIGETLRQVYRRNLAYLSTLDERFFQPGEYVYERMQGVIEHCEEHGKTLIPDQP